MYVGRANANFEFIPHLVGVILGRIFLEQNNELIDDQSTPLFVLCNKKPNNTCCHLSEDYLKVATPESCIFQSLL